MNVKCGFESVIGGSRKNHLAVTFHEPVLHCPQSSTLVAEVFTTASTAIAKFFFKQLISV